MPYRRGYRRSYGRTGRRRSRYSRQARYTTRRAPRRLRRARVPLIGIPEIKRVKFRTAIDKPLGFFGANQNAAFNTYQPRLKANSLYQPFNNFSSGTDTNTDTPFGASTVAISYAKYRVYMAKVKATISNNSTNFTRSLIMYVADGAAELATAVTLDEVEESSGGHSRRITLSPGETKTVTLLVTMSKYLSIDTNIESQIGGFNDQTIQFTDPTQIVYVKFAFGGNVQTTASNFDIQANVVLTQYVTFSDRRPVY